MAKHEAHRVLRPAEGKRRRSRYVAALDGLRAFAVLAVIAYHMGMSWAPGGLMGVTVFFVISGYLINGLLVAEYDSTGTISLSQFWLRRVRRIIPAVLVALAGTLVLCALLNPSLFDKARTDLLPSLFFVNNWWQVFRDVSYFEAAGAPSPLTHYWSLAIEEQFYIVWPLLLLALFKARAPKQVIAVAVGVLAVASFGEMAWLYDPLADPSRVYYGTDTRAGSLLLGALLALIWPSTIFGHRRTQSRSAGARFGVNVAGVAALAGLVVVVHATNSYTSFPYVGGIALVSVLTAVLIAVLVIPYTWVARLFQLRPLVWVGKRSYGMYLWHYPIVLATTNAASTVEVPWWVRLAQLVIICAVADLSYRFVETPIRSGALGKWLRARRGGKAAGSDGAVAHSGLQRVAVVGTASVCAALFVGSAAALAIVPHASSDAQSSMPQSALVAGSAASVASGEPPDGSQPAASIPSASEATNHAESESPQAAASSSSAASQAPQDASEASSPASASAASTSTASAQSAQASASSAGSGPASSSEGASAPSSSASGSASPSSSVSEATPEAPSSAAAASGQSEASGSRSSSDASQTSPASSPIASASSAQPSSGSASAASKEAPNAAWFQDAVSAAQEQAHSNIGQAKAKVESAQAEVSSLVGAVMCPSSSESANSADAASMVAYSAVQAAVQEAADALTDEERAQAEESLRGVVQRVVEATDARVDESIREAERQRKQDAYDAIFAVEHYNDAGGMIYEPLLIGDSVAAGCENEFYRTFPNGHSDAMVNRNIWESPYEYYVATNQVGEYVVFCLGTNNAVVDEQVDEMMSLVAPDKKVILVNIRAPRDWETQTNEALASAAKRYDNIVGMVDWYAESAGHDEYFFEDGIHLNAVGAAAYIQLIQNAIKATID